MKPSVGEDVEHGLQQSEPYVLIQGLIINKDYKGYFWYLIDLKELKIK